MENSPISVVAGEQLAALMPLYRFVSESPWAMRHLEPTACDFVFGNPHDPVVPGYSEALAKWSQPQNNSWFAYAMSEPKSREIVVESLKKRLGIDFDPADIQMTNGAFAGLAVAIRAVANPWDEIIYCDPPWFFYEAIIRGGGSTPVPVNVCFDTFDLDLEAISAAITPKTRAIIINSPHNPTGKIYSAETLQRLAGILNESAERHGRPIYLISDEAYSRIVFDGRDCPSPVQFYPYTLLVYTYGKTLLTPGQRIGYVAVSPTMPDRETVRYGVIMAQIMAGYAFPNALLQHALGDLERLSIDVDRLESRRNRVVASLREAGYEAVEPEGTFYVLTRSPDPDDLAFCDRLGARDVFVLPGTMFQLPGWFRISLTASDEMIDRALPIFAKLGPLGSDGVETKH